MLEENDKAELARLGVGLSNSFNTNNAGHSYTKGTYSNHSGFSGSFSSRTYNETEAVIAKLAADNKVNRENLNIQNRLDNFQAS